MSEIWQGTTPILTFRAENINFLSTQKIELTLRDEAEKLTFTSPHARLTIAEHSVSITLTQEETYRLAGNVYAQIRLLYADGKVGASDAIPVAIKVPLYEGVIE